ncbi:MAG: acyltransferase [Bacteroidaceae bacterium]|nr:acyltransferase [Bacteroidaceae bacterium]
MKYNTLIRGLYFVWRKFSNFFIHKNRFTKYSKNVIITPPLYAGNYKNVYLGEGVCIGPNASISALNAKFICKGHCAIAENLTVHTGNHARIVGTFVSDIRESNKPEGFDQNVVIEEDVWIGCNVTLLAGVNIGRGTTVAAGAVVAKSMPPYCICGGVPARFIKFYWTVDQILEHEAKLYEEKDRYTREQLGEFYSKYNL